MVEYEITHEFDISADGFWDLFFSDELNDPMWPVLDMVREVESYTRSGEGPDETIDRVQKLTPQREIPKVMKKLIDGAISYTEHNHWRRGDSEMSVETFSNFMTEKVTQKGVFAVKALGADRCARTYKGHVEVRVPLVGKTVEKIIAEEIRETYDRSANFIREFLAKR